MCLPASCILTQGPRALVHQPKEFPVTPFLIRRYISDNDDVYLPEGPVAQSQGADLADWLLQQPPDPVFHAVTRVNIYEDVALPTGEPDASQSLSFDLKGLAACLETLPLHQVLRLPPTLWTERRESITAQIPLESSFPENLLAREVLKIPREESHPAELGKIVERSVERVRPTVLPASQEVAAEVQSSVDASTKMKLLLTTDDNESQLDMLLEMSAGPRTAGSGATRGPSAPKDQSLEDWLESL